MEIEFPIFSYPKWELEVLGDFFRFDDIYFSSDEKLFDKYFFNQKFVDCKGNVFKIIGKSKITKPWLLSFFLKRSKIHFYEMEENISLEKLKRILNEKNITLESEAARKEINRIIQNSPTIRELLRGI